MPDQYAKLPSYLLGFHGCDKEVGLKVLNGHEALKPSTNEWDWLGHGIYFWEHNPLRALQYAEDIASGRQKAKYEIKTPFVIGCIIDLGFCLNLTEPSQYSLVKAAYNGLIAISDEETRELLKNHGKARILDCAVFMHLHYSLKKEKRPPFDTLRGAFPEGKPIYKGCAIDDQTHIQICVRNPQAILGYFLPLPVKKVNPHL